MNNKGMTAALIYEFKINGLYDGYGVTMAWLFALADYVTFDLYSEAPSDWEYKAALSGANDEAWEYQVLVDFAPTEKQLGYFMKLVYRYYLLLIAAGKDY